MSIRRHLLLRAFAVGGAAVLTLALPTGVASGQTGSLESGFGLDLDSLPLPVEDLFPDPGSLDGAVSAADADAGTGVGSAGAPDEALRALPLPSGGGSAGAGSLDPLQPDLGAGVAAGPDSAALGVLGAGSEGSGEPGAADAGATGQAGDGPGVGPGAELGGGLVAVAAMTVVRTGQDGDTADPVALPPLPALR